MKKLVKIAAVFITCLCLSSILPGHAEAAKRNAGDVAKLQKIVNSQIKQTPPYKSSLSKDVKTDKHYKWDKNGYLKSIYWDTSPLYGSIKIPSFKKLKSIYIYDTVMLKILKIEDNKALKDLICHNNPFGADEQDENYGFNKLEIKGCHNLRRISTGGNNKNSVNLDLSNYPKLKELSLDLNYIKEIDLSQNKQLESLDLSYNELEEIDLSHNNKLKKLNLDKNKLNKLDISNLTNLQELQCSGNQISSLDLTNNKKLEALYCPNNKITELDIHNCQKLIENSVSYYQDSLVCDNNVKIKK